MQGLLYPQEADWKAELQNSMDILLRDYRMNKGKFLLRVPQHLGIGLVRELLSMQRSARHGAAE
jgi:hypothetical protein